MWFKRINKLSLLFGSGLTFFYFVDHRYSPIESLNSIGSVVVLVAILVVLLGLSLVVTWGFPAVLTNVIANNQKLRTVLTGLVEVKKGSGAPLSPALINPTKLMGLSLGVFALPWAAVLAYKFPDYFGGASIHGWMSAAFGISAFLCLLPCLLAGSMGQIAQRATFVLALFGLGSGPMFVFLKLVTIAPVGQSSNVEVVRWLLIAVLLLITASAAININLALSTEKKTAVGQLLVLILSLAWLVMILEVPGELLDQIMVDASVRLTSAQVVLNEEGCRALDLYPPRASPQTGSSPNAAASCLLSNVLVVSRIGEHWRLGCPGHRRAGIVIAGKHIQSWSTAASGVEPDARVAQICAGLVPRR